MSIINCDILIEGIRRDAAFEWLADPANHMRFVEGSFDNVEKCCCESFRTKELAVNAAIIVVGMILIIM